MRPGQSLNSPPCQPRSSPAVVVNPRYFCIVILPSEGQLSYSTPSKFQLQLITRPSHARHTPISGAKRECPPQPSLRRVRQHSTGCDSTLPGPIPVSVYSTATAARDESYRILLPPKNEGHEWGRWHIRLPTFLGRAAKLAGFQGAEEKRIVDVETHHGGESAVSDEGSRRHLPKRRLVQVSVGRSLAPGPW